MVFYNYYRNRDTEMAGTNTAMEKKALENQEPVVSLD